MEYSILGTVEDFESAVELPNSSRPRPTGAALHIPTSEISQSAKEDALASHRSRQEDFEKLKQEARSVRQQEKELRDTLQSQLLIHERIALNKEERVRQRWEETQKYAMLLYHTASQGIFTSISQGVEALSTTNGEKAWKE